MFINPPGPVSPPNTLCDSLPCPWPHLNADCSRLLLHSLHIKPLSHTTTASITSCCRLHTAPAHGVGQSAHVVCCYIHIIQPLLLLLLPSCAAAAAAFGPPTPTSTTTATTAAAAAAAAGVVAQGHLGAQQLSIWQQLTLPGATPC